MAKKIVISLFCIVLALMLCSCSKSYDDIAGYKDIVNARKLYTGLYSGHLTVTDKSTDTLTQEVYFRYDSADVLEYSYFGTDGNTKYYEYHNDTEYYYTENNEWKKLTIGEQGFRIYTKSYRINIVDEGMIFLKGDNITDAKVEETDSGKKITYTYDAQSLNTSMVSQLGLVGELKEFSVIYNLDKKGFLTSMEQLGKSELSGKPINIDYLLVVDHMNDMPVIEKPKADFE